jgi:hypothetical protein
MTDYSMRIKENSHTMHYLEEPLLALYFGAKIVSQKEKYYPK